MRLPPLCWVCVCVEQQPSPPLFSFPAWCSCLPPLLPCLVFLSSSSPSLLGVPVFLEMWQDPWQQEVNECVCSWSERTLTYLHTHTHTQACIQAQTRTHTHTLLHSQAQAYTHTGTHLSLLFKKKEACLVCVWAGSWLSVVFSLSCIGSMSHISTPTHLLGPTSRTRLLPAEHCCVLIMHTVYCSGVLSWDWYSRLLSDCVSFRRMTGDYSCLLSSPTGLIQTGCSWLTSPSSLLRA